MNKLIILVLLSLFSATTVIADHTGAKIMTSNFLDVNSVTHHKSVDMMGNHKSVNNIDVEEVNSVSIMYNPKCNFKK